MNEMEEALAAVCGGACGNDPRPENPIPAEDVLAAIKGPENLVPVAEALEAHGNTENPVLAPEKVPAGKFLVAVMIDRNEETAGQYMDAVPRQGWQPSGCAIALSAGKVVACNFLLGHWSSDRTRKIRFPKIVASSTIRCSKCGRIELLQKQVWEAKDTAKRTGVTEAELRKMSAFKILHKWGRCSAGGCGGSWEERPDEEKKELLAFADKVLREVETRTEIGEFVPPRFFTVHGKSQARDLGPQYAFIQKALLANGQAAVPFDKNPSGDVMLYNPEKLNIGWTDDFDKYGLFFFEEGVDAKGRLRGGFNPRNINGL